MSAQEAITDILQQVLDEYGGRLNIHGESDVLVSDESIARAVYATTAAVRTQVHRLATAYGPRITVAAREAPSTTTIEGVANSRVVGVEGLGQDEYSHAVFGVAGEDPKYILQGLKHTVQGLRPKGYAVVISVKQESGATGSGGFRVGLEEKLVYQSKGRVKCLSDVLEYAGFERGRVRSLGMKSRGEEGQEAEVLLAMKWDQITA